MAVNSTHYLLAGISDFINGKRFVNLKISESGSWQRVAYAKGYNLLTELFATKTAFDAYCEKIHRSALKSEQQFKRVYLAVERQGVSSEIDFPVMLSAVKNIRKLLESQGFKTLHLTA